MRKLFFLIAGAVVIASVMVGSFGAYRVLQRANAPQAVSSTIPFETADGRTLSVVDFNGRYVLLNVWATWCPPCVKELPSLDRLQARMGGPSFEVVALSIDRKGLDAIRAFYKATSVTNLAVYLDREGKSMSALKITGLPTTILLDPRGREVGRWLGPKEWDDAAAITEVEAAMAKSAEQSR
ncbi:thiol-disulfide isomerase/thioredoxin [Bosea sp. BE271]|uniref:TlpA family protein disulfide reductase n=1 Tax=Bosea TaxID=85413 RepID=UPI00285F2DC3|nr:MULTISPECIES: TlpA disulfide reductase family protein [Bosea]MDR6826321.1 thiol-disulfide isomerase/thioredoxin [Bosea robiniae]MDR6893031.1 thiol-disulfide isomerase/thioredoxin [Bosea sp. BE109]MDR7137271.1 thiol-disulfide isomerase/thioredoxin [Bosea sp. BE168]MDR7173971.1 thiol-disulfide isomerase/thioredoxin [Bosea sp. BE271]